MIKVTRWSPDTCTCVLEYEWDTEEPEDTRTVSVVNIMHRCSAHESLADMNDCFDTVLEESTRKNKVFGMAVEISGSITPADCVWNYDVSRVLHITFGAKLTAQERTQLQDSCDSDIGAGKVVVE